MRLWLVASTAVLLALLVPACGNRDSDDDKPSTPQPSAAGAGPHIADISDPGKKTHAAPNANVNVTGVVVTWVDQFDETNDGKSRGTIYVQDLESHAPFAGIGLFAPTFVPSANPVFRSSATTRKRVRLSGIFTVTRTWPFSSVCRRGENTAVARKSLRDVTIDVPRSPPWPAPTP